MPFFKYHNIKISAVAAAVPTTRIKVEDFANKYGQNYIEKFMNQTGVREFRKSLEHQTASDLCYSAAQKIIKEKNIIKDEIGALIFVSHSGDYRRPATACVLHKRLGLSKNCAAFDISLGCSAFVYGLQAICSLMQCSDIKKGLLLVGETLSKMVYPEDRSVSMLFGDGGAAILFEKEEASGDIYGLVKSNGSGYKAIIAPAGGFRNMNATKEVFTWADGNPRTLYNTYMAGEDVFIFTISDVPKTIKEFMEMTGTTVADYDYYIMHQANKFIHTQLAKKLKIDQYKMPICLDRFGNTSASAIPLVLSDCFGDNNEDKNLHILMCGFGVGLSWGVVSANINCKDILPIIETDEVFNEGIINSPEEL